MCACRRTCGREMQDYGCTYNICSGVFLRGASYSLLYDMKCVRVGHRFKEIGLTVSLNSHSSRDFI